ncbi:hypothetical protein Y027_4608 [Burkholderia pseudomallei TSV5]|nr:hypothetical protein Y027_4608 [Burkholderia pseudomallei TSV5]
MRPVLEQFRVGECSSSHCGAYAPSRLNSTRYGLRATTWIVSICSWPIRRTAASTSALTALRRGGVKRPCAARCSARAEAIESGADTSGGEGRTKRMCHCSANRHGAPRAAKHCRAGV